MWYNKNVERESHPPLKIKKKDKVIKYGKENDYC